MTLKAVALVAVPTGVVTVTRPLDPPLGTSATICFAVSEMMPAGIPLKVTLVAPSRCLPVMETVVPSGPELGEKLLMSGVTGVGIRPTVSSCCVIQMAPSGPPVIAVGYWRSELP